MSSPTFIPLTTYHEYPVEKMKRRAAEFYADIRQRRTVREFSDRPVPLEVIKDCLRAAGSAPSGANLQPWHFESCTMNLAFPMAGYFLAVRIIMFGGRTRRSFMQASHVAAAITITLLCIGAILWFLSVVVSQLTNAEN